MRRALVVVLAALAVLFEGTGSGLAVSGKGPLRTLVDAERGFARRASDASTREAFAENLGPGAVVFRPGATNHHEWAKARPEWGTKGLLTWDPSFGRTSTSGDFGYTTGPAQFRTTRDLKAEPVYWGYFVSVWSREGGGPWRVLLDIGTSTPKPDQPVARFEPIPSMERLPVPALADRRAGLEKLIRAEEALGAAVVEKGITKAYLEALAESGRVHRDEHVPMIGREPGVSVLDSRRTAVTWKVVEAKVASSADLGYAYGTGEAKRSDGTVEKFSFLRIWEPDRKQVWRIVLDVENPIPEEK
ncbi:MAG: nuclear transport factor 2 family protein [Blastocatellia bacterium]|nr:nuclear transport factor 2 family protein [Blastocatellia bacterium]